MKKIAQITVMGIASAATAITLAGGANAATGSDTPTFADRGTVSVSGGSGSTVITMDFRTGSFGTTRDSLAATLPTVKGEAGVICSKGQTNLSKIIVCS